MRKLFATFLALIVLLSTLPIVALSDEVVFSEEILLDVEADNEYEGDPTDTDVGGEVVESFEGDIEIVPAPEEEEEVEVVPAPLEEPFQIEDGVLLAYNGADAEVVVPEGVTTIAGFSFSGNVQIVKVILPETLEIIEDSAFLGCSQLTEVVFPIDVEVEIGTMAFEGCENLVMPDETVEEVEPEIEIQTEVEEEEAEQADAAEEALQIRSKALSITKQPTDYVGALGSRASFTVTASGTGLSYQWQWQKAGTTTWSNSSSTGAKTATLSLDLVSANVGNAYRCIIKDSSAATVTSKVVKLIQKLEITKQPVDYVGALNSKASFTVTASGSGLSYQWQWQKAGTTTWSNSGSTGAKTATLSLDLVSANVGNAYRCIIKDNNGNQVISSTARLVQKVTITKQPVDYKGAFGTKASFTLTAVGSNLTYQWQWQKAGTTTWSNSSSTGAKTATLSLDLVSANVGNAYRCVVTDAYGNTATSNTAKLLQGITITEQPVDYVGQIGSKATFTINAKGNSLSYQWQWQKAGTTTWSNSGSTGAKTATLSLDLVSANVGNAYRCVVTDNAGNSIISSSAKLVVGISITKQPVDYVGSLGSAASFSVTAKGSNLTYQWQWQKAGTTSWNNSGSNGASTPTLSLNLVSGNVGNAYRCVISDSSGNSVTSNVAKLIQKLEINQQPSNYVGAIGSAATFSVSAVGSGLKYQWQWQKAGTSTWSNSGSAGATTATLSLNLVNANVGNAYRCIITDSFGSSVTSNSAKLVAKLTVTKQPQDYVGIIGSKASFTVAASGSGLKYQWQWQKAGTTTWSNSGSDGAKTANLSLDLVAGNVGNAYRCIISDSSGASVTSNTARLVATVSITKQPVDYTGALGSEASFTVAAYGSGLKYQWQWQKAGTTTWSNSGSNGATTPTLTLNLVKANVGNAYRCIVTDANGAQVMSDTAKLVLQTTYVENNVIYELVNDEMVVTGYETAAVSYTVANSVGGYPVTKIGDSAFEGNQTLQSINLPDSIAIIGKRAFANCTNLSSMN